MGWIVLGSAVAATLAALGAERLGLLSPLYAFGVFLLAWIGGGIATVLVSALALRRGAGVAAWPTLLLGALLLAALAMAATRGRGPAIHDITTDPEDPPQFTAAVSAPGNRGRDLTYPHGRPQVPDLQRAAYPDLATLRFEAAAPQAHEAAIEVARELGWMVTWSHLELGIIEATATTRLFRFVDDVVIRIRATGDGSEVDLRSTSRVGRSDLGANAARIRAFSARLRAASDPSRRTASVP